MQTCEGLKHELEKRNQVIYEYETLFTAMELKIKQQQ